MERVLKLLEPPVTDPDRTRGYLDLLPEGPGDDSIAQRLMRSSALPQIYERLWRPALIGLAKGPLGPSTAQEMALIRDLLALSPGDVVLDVACGPGNVARALAPAVGEAGLVVGLDASASMLDQAVAETARSPYRERLEFVRADAVSLPFHTGCFDAVSCFAALYLFDWPFEALSSMARVLRPGGRLAILTTRRLPGIGPLNDVFGRLSGVRMFGDDEVSAALAERGFTEVRRRRSGLMQFVAGVRGS